MMDMKKRLIKNNKGSALIVSIIILLFVSILATVILYIAGVNYRMKKNELKTKTAFYSGEIYLERIQGNLIIPVSEAMNEAYRITNTNYYALGNADDRRESFYLSAYDELKDILINCYGETTSITDGNGTVPSNSEFIKNIMHNITGSGPDATDGILFDRTNINNPSVTRIYCNDNNISGVTYQEYNGATAFVDKILENNSDFFVGDSTGSDPRYYIVLYSKLNQSDPGGDDDITRDLNYEQFISLDIYKADGITLKDPNECRMLLKNVCVVCVQNGYRSIISTDIAIQFPPLDWDNGNSTDPATYYNMFQMFYYVNYRNN